MHCIVEKSAENIGSDQALPSCAYGYRDNS